MSYFVYILKSKKTEKYYIGQTRDIEKRILYHNSGYNKSTKHGLPWKIVFTKEFVTRVEAVHFEAKLKKMKSRRYIENLIKH